MFIVGTNFILADGSSASGYLTPPVQGDAGLGELQPVIVFSGGQVLFWCGAIEPSTEHIEKNYSLLGKDAASVFPIHFESSVQLRGGNVSGTIPGFLVLEDWKSGTTRTIR
jgi:hypothetical protein